jgi:hypothetical protein
VARTLIFSVVISSVTSIVATYVVLALVLPPAVAAQEASLRAERAIAVGPDGTDRARMALGQGENVTVSVLGTNGQTRALLGTGGPGPGQQPETADFVLWAQDGTRIARLGTRETADSHAAGVDLFLADSQGRIRLDMLVAEDGTPAIHMFDADGNLTWSAP